MSLLRRRRPAPPDPQVPEWYRHFVRAHRRHPDERTPNELLDELLREGEQEAIAVFRARWPHRHRHFAELGLVLGSLRAIRTMRAIRRAAEL